jgi:hypothetical protein
MTEIKPTIRQQVRWPILWGLILIVHMAVVGGWWWLTPKGFPVGHGRFWVNAALPWLGILLLASGVRSLARPSRFRDAIRIMTPGFWVGAGITAAVLFPSSSVKLLPLFIPMALGLSLFAAISLQRTRRETLAFLAGAFLGAFVLFSQQAPAASTRPSQTEFKAPPTNLGAADIYREGLLSFDPAKERISIAVRDTTIELWPLLSFYSRSPDRCWTSLASSQDREGPDRRLLGVETSGPEWVAFYRSDFSSRLSVNAKNSKVVTLESTAHLVSPLYSHLNAYCHLSVTTPGPVSIVFSPCPDTPIEVRFPARHAHLAEDGFHVVEAATGAKGPFTELASGPLTRGEPVSLTFVIDNTPRFRFELKDWSSEASTELSPTAGWGVPMNSIELWPSERGCSVVITLAGTSVGRGWDSVGHREGIYRGRMLVELFD